MEKADLQESASPTVRGARVKEIGGAMFTLFLVSLLAAKFILRIFFPELRGVTSVSLAVFIPIWSVGLVGAVLWLIGWVRAKTV